MIEALLTSDNEPERKELAKIIYEGLTLVSDDGEKMSRLEKLKALFKDPSLRMQLAGADAFGESSAVHRR